LSYSNFNAVATLAKCTFFQSITLKRPPLEVARYIENASLFNLIA